MAGLDDVSLAMRMRDTIARMVREVLSLERPPDRFGRAIDVNRFFGRCSVLLNGDTEPISVKMSNSMQPYILDATHGVGQGQMVRVSGTPGNYWITQIMSGQGYSLKEKLFEPFLFGGTFFQTNTAIYSTASASALQGIDQTYHFGRWENTGSFGGAVTSFLEVNLIWTFFTSNVKRYEIPVQADATGGVWKKLAPVQDTGERAGHDMELEIKVDTTGFELRARRINFDPGGFTPGGMRIEMWIHGDSFLPLGSPSELGVETTTAPTGFFQNNKDNRMKGPFQSPGQHVPIRAQSSLSGGTDITYNGTNLIWSVSFRVGLVSKNLYTPGGWYDLPMPSVGTVIPVFGSNTHASKTSVTAGIPFDDGDALYCEIPWGDATSTTVNSATYAIVHRTETGRQFQVPSHWILLAFVENGRFVCMSTDDWRPKVQLVQGTAQTGWVTSTWNSVTFSATDILDTHGMHSTSTNNNRINIGRMKGWWQIGGMYAAASNSAATLIRSAIALNGTRVPGSMQTLVFPSTGSVICTVCSPIWIEATSSSDWVELQAMETGPSGTLGTAVTADNASALWANYGRSS